MTWNHRILRHANGDLEIVEVYYNDDGSLMGWADADVYAHADADGGTASLARQVLWYRQALDKPIVDVSDFGAQSEAPAAPSQKGLNLDNERRNAPSN